MTDPMTPPVRFATSEDQLHAAASAQLGGWSDFGPLDYRRGLEVLLHSMDYDPRWSEIGRTRGWAGLVKVLAKRATTVLSGILDLVRERSMQANQTPRLAQVRKATTDTIDLLFKDDSSGTKDPSSK